MRSASTRLAVLAVCFALAVPAALTGARATTTVENGNLPSFDGTPLSYTFFSVGDGKRHPVVLMTHGWGGSRTTSATDPTVAMLLKAKYNVLTWDSRGFGTSGGEVNVDSQEFEARDVSALLTFAAHRRDVLLDGPNDPRAGMLGASYAGGIQLQAAAADRRIDAIVPEWAWNDLPYAIKPNGVVKLGWGTLLYGLGVATATEGGLSAGQTGSLNPTLHEAFAESAALNDWTPDVLSWFQAKSPSRYIAGGRTPDGRRIGGIHAPTLMIQGTKDTLFNLNQAIANYNELRPALGDTVKMVWFCGGHSFTGTGPLVSSCKAGDSDVVINARILGWFKRYLDRDASVNTGPQIEYQLQDGSFRSVASLPRTKIDFKGTATVVNLVAPTSGQVVAAGPGQADSTRIPIAVPAGAQILGIGRLRVSLTPTAPETYLFFKLIDTDAGGNAVVVDDQATPYKLFTTAIGQANTFSVDIAGAAWSVAPGHKIWLEISPNSNDFSSSRIPSVCLVTVTGSVPILR
ncbi:MAG TPA: alpha/beta fold hydrolase [Actinomycetota bacterium]|nr:alpha/beta fold hydrolase [Actinomycetota bacterium]